MNPGIRGAFRMHEQIVISWVGAASSHGEWVKDLNFARRGTGDKHIQIKRCATVAGVHEQIQAKRD